VLTGTDNDKIDCFHGFEHQVYNARSINQCMPMCSTSSGEEKEMRGNPWLYFYFAGIPHDSAFPDSGLNYWKSQSTHCGQTIRILTKTA